MKVVHIHPKSFDKYIKSNDLGKAIAMINCLIETGILNEFNCQIKTLSNMVSNIESNFNGAKNMEKTEAYPLDFIRRQYSKMKISLRESVEDYLNESLTDILAEKNTYYEYIENVFEWRETSRPVVTQQVTAISNSNINIVVQGSILNEVSITDDTLVSWIKIEEARQKFRISGNVSEMLESIVTALEACLEDFDSEKMERVLKTATKALKKGKLTFEDFMTKIFVDFNDAFSEMFEKMSVEGGTSITSLINMLVGDDRSVKTFENVKSLHLAIKGEIDKENPTMQKLEQIFLRLEAQKNSFRFRAILANSQYLETAKKLVS